MQPVEAEMPTDDAQLLDERLDRPQGRVVREVGLSTADLVVEDHAPPALGHRLERLEVVMRPARSPVQAEERQLSLILRFADDPVPRPVLAERDVALGPLHLSVLT